MSKFLNCLQQGNKYELLLLKYVKYLEYELSPAKCKEYDIIIDNVKYEVKSEKNAYKYNNFAIEYFYNNKPSGIDATSAKYWVHYNVKPDSNDCYIIPVEDLKDMIEKKMYNRNIINGGDGNKASFYLFKVDLFKKYLSELLPEFRIFH